MQTLGDVITVVVAVAALLIVPYKIAKAWLWPHIKPFFALLFGGPDVNHYQDSASDIMSRSADGDRPFARPPLGRTEPRTDGQMQLPTIPHDVMLNNLRMLRAYGVPRDKARQLINSLGASFKNDLWTEATPPDDEYVTPIAGRPTKAQFENDPDLVYQPPS